MKIIKNNKNPDGFSIQTLPFKKEPVGGSNANPKECRVALNAKEEKPLDYTGGKSLFYVEHFKSVNIFRITSGEIILRNI